MLTEKLLRSEGADCYIDLPWRYYSINDYRPSFSEGTPETALIVGQIIGDLVRRHRGSARQGRAREEHAT